MASFRYEAMATDGATLGGRLDAPDLRSASRELKKRGLMPISIEAVAQRGVGRKRKTTAKDRLLAINDLVTLISAGVPLGEVLPALVDGDENSVLAGAFTEMDRQLKRGRPFVEALRAGLPELPDYVFQLAQIGSETGDLAAALKDAHDQMEYDARLRQDIRNALVYPTVLVTAGVLAVLFIFVAVVPRFSAMFAERMDTLPWLSAVIFKIGNAVNSNLLLTFGGLAAFVMAVVAVARMPKVQTYVRETALRVPLVGAWIIEVETARWAGMASKLLNNSVPMMRALALARASLQTRSLVEPMDQVERAVRSGVALSRALGDYTVFDSTSINMIRVGERAGNLPHMLHALGDMHERSSRNRLKRLLLLIEPVAIILIGGVIGVFVSAIILAINSINQIAQ